MSSNIALLSMDILYVASLTEGSAYTVCACLVGAVCLHNVEDLRVTPRLCSEGIDGKINCK